jgi:pilus assembly protein Flp/PilA
MVTPESPMNQSTLMLIGSSPLLPIDKRDPPGEHTMNKIKNVLSQLMVEESGQNLIEYALVAGIIGLGAVVAMTTLKNSISTAFSSVGSALTSAV